MKPLLLLVLIALIPAQQQPTVERKDPDLSVLKFSWSKEKQKSSMIRGAQNPGGPITTPISNDRDLKSRRIDVNIMEKKASASSGGGLKPGETYRLRLEIENTGTNVVNYLIWEFKQTAGPDDYQPNQYLCALRVKPEEKKNLELLTPYAPVKVIKVDASENALKDGEVVINKIEYADGSVWKRRGWYYKLPAEASQKLSDGQCSVFWAGP